MIALATRENNQPFVRYVNGYYEDSSFYAIIYTASRKMRQLVVNSRASIVGEWFTANAEGRNLGYFGKPENAALAQKLRNAFASWIDNGHNDFSDENTVILALRLTDGVLFSLSTRYDIDFSEV